MRGIMGWCVCVQAAKTGDATNRDVFNECGSAWLLCQQPALTVGLEEQVDGSVSATHHGFMQHNIIASHTCFGEHMDVNC